MNAIAAPAAIVEWTARFAAHGHASRIVGESALRVALGLQSNHHTIESSISADELRALAPRAIPTGVRSGAWTLPTSAGPIELHPGLSSERGRAHRDMQPFRILALRFDPSDGSLDGTAEALDDLERGILAPNPTPHRDDVSPDFALEAARLIAVYGLSPAWKTSELARTLPADSPSRERQPRMRFLIRSILQGAHVRVALEWMRSTGTERALVSGVRDQAAALVAALPNRVSLRMFAWLVTAHAKPFLRDLRFGGEFSAKLYRLAAHHPIDQYLDPTQDAAVNKLLRHLSPAELRDLFALRQAEAALLRDTDRVAEADVIAQALGKLTDGIERVRTKERQREARGGLALSGRDIMQRLDCPAGPEVGRAIRFLEQRVATDPGANTPERLGECLDEFRLTAQLERNPS